MDLTCEERPSDSPLVERVWRSHSDHAMRFISMAETHWSIVVTKLGKSMTLTVRGPETRTTPAYGPGEAEWAGIMFKPGAFMPTFPAGSLMNRHDINLPEARCQSFWLNSSIWQYFDFENAECFVERLVREDLLVYDPVVCGVLHGETIKDMTLRTVQRRFLQATGLTHGKYCQIKRARHAVTLLKAGKSILDVVVEAGYTDQPHLTRSLKRFMGQTPAQITSENRHIPMSFLFKTPPY